MRPKSTIIIYRFTESGGMGYKRKKESLKIPKWLSGDVNLRYPSGYQKT